MRYSYYPGCTLKTTGSQYDSSAKAVLERLGSELVEIEDWNCCGSTASDMVSPLLSVSLAGRNLALAEMSESELVATCSACFLNLYRVQKYVQRDPELGRKLDTVLAEIGLKYRRRVRVRHLLDVIANDIGVEAVRRQVQQPLRGLRVAPYYGCLVVRPYAEFDGPDLPVSMDRLLEAIGAQPIPYLVKTRCCGGALINTKKSVGLKLLSDLLSAARGADCIVTVCPLCQLNLDAYQAEVSRYAHINFDTPVLYLTQLIGLAFGLQEDAIKLGQNIVPVDRLLSRVRRASALV